MAMIKGITVKLAVRTQVGVDSFNNPIYEDNYIDVDNVLVGEPGTNDIVDTLNLYGKRLAYTLAIPKGDTNDWTDTFVQFFGQTFRTFGLPIEGIEENIPLSWNKKVKVEKYGEG